MAPLKDHLSRPSHSTLRSMTFPPIIDITEEEEKEPTKSEELQLRLKFGGRITTGGSGKSHKQPKLSDPTISTVPPKQRAPPTLRQMLRFDLDRLPTWPSFLTLLTVR
jgi:hypothetical protein